MRALAPSAALRAAPPPLCGGGSSQSLRKPPPRRGGADHCSVRRQRLDAELVSVHLARRRRRANEARGESIARHFRLAAIADRAAAVMEARSVEIRHGEAQIDGAFWHVGQL